MVLTLGHFIKNNESLLQTKKSLLSLKKDGVIFFRENVELLESDSPIQVYLCYFPHSSSTINAFPVHPLCYRLYNDTSKQVSYLKQAFADYYGKQIKEPSFFLDYKCYHAKKWVWYYKE